MDKRFREETERLAGCWSRRDREELGRYLVCGVEDPRVNVQSILTRHFLLRRLFPRRFEALMEGELRFAAVMNLFLRGAADPLPPYARRILDALPAEADGLTVPDYGRDASASRGLFERLWAEALAGERAGPLRVLEPACGSANDYRFLASYGLVRFLEYDGFDLCPKNIDNARRWFGPGRFRVGNALEIDAADGSYDVCFVHDLFEHLSVRAMERAAGEVFRVARSALCMGFFNMHAGPEHVVKRVGGYHWNCLSAPRVRDLFERLGGRTEVVSVDRLLRDRLGCPDTHNKGAHTVVVTRPAAGGRRIPCLAGEGTASSPP